MSQISTWGLSDLDMNNDNDNDNSVNKIFSLQKNNNLIFSSHSIVLILNTLTNLGIKNPYFFNFCTAKPLHTNIFQSIIIRHHDNDDNDDKPICCVLK